MNSRESLTGEERWAAAAGDRESRRRMVEEQLARRGIHDQRVLEAMRRVAREDFVPADSRDRAYEDSALAISHGQTISQPFTVAFMCQELRLRGDEKLLEIGTGSGYAAAVLSLLVRQVFTIERISALSQTASALLRELGRRNITVLTADGSNGYPEEAPFDAIVAAAAAEQIPPALTEQLAEGGRLVLPIGPHGRQQRMQRITRCHGQLMKEDLGAFAFVPLIAGNVATPGESD